MHNGTGELALPMSNGSQTALSPPTMSSPSSPSLTPTNATQKTPSQGSLLNRADGVTSLVILPHYDALTKANTIALSREILAQRAELAEHAQRVEAMRSTALAEWCHQEDAAQAKAFSDKADMHRHHDPALQAIMAARNIRLANFRSMVVYYVRAEESMHATALVETHRCNDAAYTKQFHDNCTADVATATHRVARAVAKKQSEEDAFHSHLFASIQGRQDATGMVQAWVGQKRLNSLSAMDSHDHPLKN